MHLMGLYQVLQIIVSYKDRCYGEAYPDALTMSDILGVFVQLDIARHLPLKIWTIRGRR